MAYITTELVAQIRKELKAAFPQVKFSVTREHHSSIRVAIMAAPFKIEYLEGGGDVKDINYYRADWYTHSDKLNVMLEIINKTNFDKSDSQSDYFYVGYYVAFTQGKWDKPFVLKEA